MVVMKRFSQQQVLQQLTDAATEAEERGRYKECEVFLDRALLLACRADGEKDQHYATLLMQLADVAAAQGKLHKAEMSYLEAIHILQSVMGEMHISVGIGYRNLSEIFRELGKEAEADGYLQKAANILRF